MPINDLNARLKRVRTEFARDPQWVRNRVNTLVRITHEAFARIEKLEAELNRLKQPTLFPVPPPPPPKPPEPVLSFVDRVRNFLENNPHSPDFHRMLKIRGLTVDEARKLVDDANLPPYNGTR